MIHPKLEHAITISTTWRQNILVAHRKKIYLTTIHSCPAQSSFGWFKIRCFVVKCMSINSFLLELHFVCANCWKICPSAFLYGIKPENHWAKSNVPSTFYWVLGAHSCFRRFKKQQICTRIPFGTCSTDEIFQLSKCWPLSLVAIGDKTVMIDANPMLLPVHSRRGPVLGGSKSAILGQIGPSGNLVSL